MHASSIENILTASNDARSGMPITYVKLVDGREAPLSCYGDDVIDFSPYISNPACHLQKVRLAPFPRSWRHSITDLTVAYWRYGRPGQAAPEASTVVSSIIILSPYVAFLESLGVHSFSQIRPIHIQAYSRYLNEQNDSADSAPATSRTPEGVSRSLTVVALPWDLRKHLHDKMTFPPFEWGDISRMAGAVKRGARSVKTKAMTDDEAAKLIATCDLALSNIDELVVREKMIQSWLTDNESTYRTYSTLRNELSRYVISIGFTLKEHRYRKRIARAAALAELGLLTGLRASEILSLEQGCYFVKEHNGHLLGWLSGTSFKMKKKGARQCEWLAPSRVGEIVKIIEALTSPLRARLVAATKKEELLIGIGDCPEREAARRALQLATMQRDCRLLFLTESLSKGKAAADYVGAVRSFVIASDLKLIATIAKIPFHLHPHALRRTFAVIVVHKCSGDLRYLRKHFQHWSIETTQLYATHEKREQELADEIAEELLRFKTDTVLGWLDTSVPLAGKGGAHIESERQKPMFQGQTNKSLRAVATSVADGIVLRSTGHTWCISSGLPTCGGHGLYDATHCADCDGAVVTKEKLGVWTLLADQMIEVDELKDCGPAGAKIAKDSLASFDQILIPFGTSVEKIREERAGREAVATGETQ